MTALNVVLAEAGLGPVGLEHARNLVGGGARLMIERGLAQHGTKFPPAEIDRMFARFLAYYEHHIADHSRPFPDAKIVLEELVRSGAILLICTNKLERYSVKLLDAMGLATYFTVVAGADTFPVRKPNPGHLLLAIERAGGDPKAAVMIGDSRSRRRHRARGQHSRDRGVVRLFRRAASRTRRRPAGRSTRRGAGSSGEPVALSGRPTVVATLPGLG